VEHWYTLHTKPRKERMVRDLLSGRGIESYLPMLKPRHRCGSTARCEKPFFPRYLFARLDLQVIPMSSVNWSQGMTSVVSFGGQPAVVPDGVIHWLRARLAQANGEDYHDGLPLVPNTPMRVVEGPLAGMEAIFDRRLSSAGRARVLIQLLGQLTTAELPIDWLRHI
jgi:transcription antitermination factor NusG